jgi:enoyl-[acyl-carrier protein] reductase/trans-2-enoyl-CoA reductase (NAD+)
MARIAERHGVRTARLCYPAMNTTALGAIPGATLMFAGTAELLLANATYRNLAALARDTMPLFAAGATTTELRLDEPFRAVLPEFHRRAAALAPGNLRDYLGRVVGCADL